jgi:purine-nucleoside phosphorylase
VPNSIGHAGQMVIGSLENVPVIAMQGRVHLYEGYSARQVAFPILVFGRMGIRAAILTNAAGGINLEYKQGALVLIPDHINLQGRNPLTGENDDRLGPRFPHMTYAYSRALLKVAGNAGQRLDQNLSEGVYAAVLGPSYETPPEIRYLRSIGADMLGRSTVPEVITARHLGIEVLAISCVTNMAAGILDQVLTAEAVLETANRVRGDFVALLRAIVPEIEKLLVDR